MSIVIHVFIVGRLTVGWTGQPVVRLRAMRRLRVNAFFCLVVALETMIKMFPSIISKNKVKQHTGFEICSRGIRDR